MKRYETNASTGETLEITVVPWSNGERVEWLDEGQPGPQGWQQITDQEAHALTAARAQANIINKFTDAIQQRLDDFARTRNYDGILSACTYVTSTVPKFAAEGQYCVQARDATWATAYQILAQVQAGQRPMPATVADIEADLPALQWPEEPA